MEYLVITLLTTLLIVRDFLHFKERKEMLDRIMAKSFIEFKDNEPKPEPKEQKPVDNEVELDDAKEDLYGEENNI